MKDEICRLLDDETSIGALPGSLQAFLVAGLFMKKKRTLLWITESNEEMFGLRDDLECFVDPSDVSVFLPCDVIPYQDDSPSKAVSAARISVLARLLDAESMIILTTRDALMPLSIPPVELESNIVKVGVDTELDREELAQRLVCMGYTREALIDDVGQFSIRGSVMDIFSPGMRHPVRIDLFGDTVEHIKNFDIDSQRSKKDVESAVILPASEVVLGRENVRRARPLIRRAGGEDLKIIIDEIEQGIYSPGIEALLPLFYEERATLVDYLSGSSVVVSPDGAAMTQMRQDVFEMYEKAYSKSRTSYPVGPAEILMDVEELEKLSGSFERHISTTLVGTPAELRFERVLKGGGTETSLESIQDLAEQGLGVFLYVSNPMLSERITYALENRDVHVVEGENLSVPDYSNWKPGVFMARGAVSESFVLERFGLAVVSGDELFGGRRKKKTAKTTQPIVNPFTQLNVGDAVVHRDNGIGLFRGIERLEMNGVRSDFVKLEYMGGDSLYVPVYRLALLQRYIGDTDSFVIDRLGGTRWSKARAKARESAAKLANELLAVYAKRESAKGYSFDTTIPAVKDFESSFPYEETEDQYKAIEEMYTDMASLRPMDRLICGDVGYGKTEVALRSAFVAAMSGKQVAVLVPTTLLARQHLETFRQRLSDWPVRVEGLTSLSSGASNRNTLKDLEEGRVDILIGTHAIISEKVKFRDLGLLVVDEEHRFGVKHKEKIKSMRSAVDVLTLTATPIPRTLNMAFSGIRDLSVIETPPAERKSVETVISRFDDDAIAQAIGREIRRGGQVFFVHNRVANIEPMADYIKVLVPDARIAVAHGQMPKTTLNRVMGEFMERKVNVLVSTSIISSGIDIPNANTIVINTADRFGIADLYQMRGRVGRSKTRGYALLLVPAVGRITKDAKKRLMAIKEYEALGAGFQMALRDMEIRGVGDILGKSQWGHVSAIGYEMYQQMLKDAVAKLRGMSEEQTTDPEISIGIDAFIPEEYCEDQHLRLGIYKRLFGADGDELASIREELEDLYGPMPGVVKSLFVVAEIRSILRTTGIKKLEMSNNRLRLYMTHDTKVNLQKIVNMVTARNGRLFPDGRAEIPMESEDAPSEIRDILYSVS